VGNPDMAEKSNRDAMAPSQIQAIGRHDVNEHGSSGSRGI
jgi:hypothetical protein